MNSEVKRTDILCKGCGWELLTVEDKVFCHNDKCRNKDGSVLLIIETLKVNDPKNYKLYSRKYIQMDYRRMQVFNSKLG